MKNYTKREHKFPKLIRNPQYPSQLLTDQRKEIEWTQKMGLNAKALREVHMLCEDIIKKLISAGYHVVSSRVFLCRIDIELVDSSSTEFHVQQHHVRRM